MTYTVHTTSKFERDIKRCKKRHLDINLLLETVEILKNTGSLPPNTTRISYPGNTQDCGNAISKETGC